MNTHARRTTDCVTTGRRLWRRARTAASFPDRLVACEDRTAALEAHVVARLDEMRAELAELRILVTQQLRADADSTELVGRLLQSVRDRLDALEAGATGVAPALAEGHHADRP